MTKALLSDRSLSWTVLAGAGCSMSEPTNIPAWEQVNSNLFDALAERAGNASATSSVARASLGRALGESMPNELVGQGLEEVLGVNYQNAFAWMLDRPPNAVHWGLARLAQDRRLAALFTTNFDRCFEKAFEEVGVRTTVLSGVKGLKRVGEASDPGEPRIVKLHGEPTADGHFADGLIAKYGEAARLRSEAFQTA